jgi:hypothetical protein
MWVRVLASGEYSLTAPELWMMRDAWRRGHPGQDSDESCEWRAIEAAYFHMSPPQQDEWMASPEVRAWLAWNMPRRWSFAERLPAQAMRLADELGLLEAIGRCERGDGRTAAELQPALDGAMAALRNCYDELERRHAHLHSHVLAELFSFTHRLQEACKADSGAWVEASDE